MICWYSRVSTDGQARVHTIEQQHEFGNNYIALMKLSLFDHYADDGVSATRPFHKRPDGQRLLADAAAGKFRKVYFYAADRFARSTLDFLTTYKALKACGVDLVSVTQAIDTSTPIGLAVMTILVTFGELEWHTIRERTVRGKLKAAREGRIPVGPAPYGYRLHDKHLVIHEPEAAVVRDLYRDYAAGASMRTLIRRLNARDVPAPRNVGWQTTLVQRILSSPTYRGEYLFRRRQFHTQDGEAAGFSWRDPSEHIPIPVPAIVAHELWDAVQQRRQTAGDLLNRADHRVYLLRRLVRCGVCGRGYNGETVRRPHHEYRYYVHARTDVDGSRAADAIACGGVMRFAAEVPEAEIKADISAFAREPTLMLARLHRTLKERTPTPATSTKQQARLARHLKAKAAERARVITLRRKGRITEAEADTELLALEAEAADLQVQLDDLMNAAQANAALEQQVVEAAATLATLKHRVDSADDAQWREWVRRWVTSVTVSPNPDGSPHFKIVYLFDAPVR